MKTTISVWLGLGALVVNAPAQLVLNTGDAYTYTFSELAISGQSGSWHNGWLFLHLDPNSVQPDDVVQVDMFEGNLDDTLIFSRAFSNTPTVGGSGTAFSWWDRTGSFRLSVLAGSVTLERMEISVVTGPVSCPCTGWYTNLTLAAGPKLLVEPRPGGQLRLSWEASFSGYQPDFTADWPAGSWSPVTSDVVRDGSRFVVDLAAGSERRYFRLRKN